MLYHLFTTWMDVVGPFRVFRYPTFRIPAAGLTALVITLWLFPRFIAALRRAQSGVDNVREDTPDAHQKKKGTPTMGGLFIVGVVLLANLFWADLKNIYVWTLNIVLIGFGAIGFIDDYRKVTKRDSKGLPGRKKLLLQFGILLLVTAILAMGKATLATELSLPFVPTKWFYPNLGFFYLPFAFLVVMGTSHAVNLTDGLDGLAIGPVIVSAITFLVLAYAAGLTLTFNGNGQWVEFNVASYLHIPFVEGTGELAIVCAAIAGAGIGFLWYNTFPASVFMGDVGSLALGGALGMVAVLTKNEVLSAVIHGVFLVEALSVIVQVLSFKWTGQRVFRMAPIHHHFELQGWPEPKIIVRFWIAAIILALVALMSLKLR